MDLCDGAAVLAFALDGMHGVTCPEVRQLRDEEAASEAEAMERWLGDRGKSNFEKIFCFLQLPTSCCSRLLHF
jgi:hypothetical protein